MIFILEYNLEAAKAKIIKQLIVEHPEYNNEQYAKELGISTRTFLRYVNQNMDIKIILHKRKGHNTSRYGE